MWQKPEVWCANALIGSLAGFSLVALFYPLFSVILFSDLPGARSTLPILKKFHTCAYILGILPYVAVAALAGLFVDMNPRTALGLIFPLAMSGILFLKASTRW